MIRDEASPRESVRQRVLGKEHRFFRQKPPMLEKQSSTGRRLNTKNHYPLKHKESQPREKRVSAKGGELGHGVGEDLKAEPTDQISSGGNTTLTW